MISYRFNNGFDLCGTMSVVMQKQVMAHLGEGASGVMFSIDPTTGTDTAILMQGIFGLGEPLVGGRAEGDTFYAFKPGIRNMKNAIIGEKIGSKNIKTVINNNRKLGEPFTIDTELAESMQRKLCLNQSEVVQLAQWATVIEDHFGFNVDIEWAKDGITGELFIVQARPETVESQRDTTALNIYKIDSEESSLNKLLEGSAANSLIGSGQVQKINSPNDVDLFTKGNVLVVDETNPDWEPMMKKAGAILTKKGSKTCHAAIIAREMGIPCIVGCTNIETLEDGREITVDCSKGDIGYVYGGLIPFSVTKIPINDIPQTDVKIMVNMANPEESFGNAKVPNDGIGLLRSEFLAARFGIHPNALVYFDELDTQTQSEVLVKLGLDIPNNESEKELLRTKLKEVYVRQHALGLAKIATAVWPNPAVTRLSDFKSNEYRNLLGGRFFEPEEKNPMMGVRGAARYYHPKYTEAFKWECEAVKYARDEIGLTNIIPMIPMCRTPIEGRKVLEIMKAYGLERGVNDLKVYVMAEIPANCLEAEEFAEIFDGFSIGSNDLTQFTLAIDREETILASIGDAANPSVIKLIIPPPLKTSDNLT